MIDIQLNLNIFGKPCAINLTPIVLLDHHKTRTFLRLDSCLFFFFPMIQSTSASLSQIQTTTNNQPTNHQKNTNYQTSYQ